MSELSRLAMRRPEPAPEPDADHGPVLSVILPVYNEEGQVREVLEQLFASPCPIRRQWIAVDDASTDSTAKILDELAETHPLQVIRQPVNRGKGASVIRGLQEVRGDFVMIHDADFEYDPADIPALLEPLLQDQADVVYGSRFKQDVRQVHRTWHRLINRLLTALSNWLSGIHLTDMETCYKLFRADLLRAMRLRSRRFEIEVELTAYVAKTHARIFELPIHYYPRTRLQGKKIGWRDGLDALVHLVRFNWGTSLDDAFQDLPAHYRFGGSPRPPSPPR